MARFHYTKKVLVRGWKEIPFTIDADNEVDADMQARKELQGLIDNDVLIGEEIISPEENCDLPTKFIYADNGEEICSNEGW